MGRNISDEVPDELTPTRFAMERSFLVVGDRTELVLVRHAQQLRSDTEARRPGGPSLSELGRDQARLTGEHLAAELGYSEPIDAVYCSDLNRTVETATIIAEAIGGDLTPRLDPTLREVDIYGRRDGGADLSADIQARAGAEFSRTLRWDAFPNTEPGEELRARIISALERIAGEHPDGRVVVVSHAGAIGAAVAGLVGAVPDAFYFAGHASVNRIFHGDGRFMTHSLNEVGHLRAAGALTF